MKHVYVIMHNNCPAAVVLTEDEQTAKQALDRARKESEEDHRERYRTDPPGLMYTWMDKVRVAT